jgi:phosphatidylinositol alpha-1,6-mannosyltransferase
MRLLLVSTEFPPGPGGIGTHSYQLAAHLARLGCHVRVASSQDYSVAGEIAAFNQAQRFEITRLRPFGPAPVEAMYRLATLQRLLWRHRPDALIASGERAVWLVALLARVNSLPWLAAGHGTEFGTTQRWEARLTRWSFSQANVVVCVSEYTRGRMHALGVRSRRDVVIPNGADERVFMPLGAQVCRDFRRRYNLGGARLLLTVGNVTNRKGQDVVIRALPEILATELNTHYLLVGMPTAREELAALAARLGVAQHVHFLGRLEQADLVAAYNACDVFVMTSRHSANGDFEGYGIAAAEAALCGRPAVVSRGAGLAEAVVDGHTGLHVAEDDPRDTAAAITRLLQDAALSERLGRQAHERALREQTWARCVGEYYQLLQELAAGRAMPSVKGAGEAPNRLSQPSPDADV